MPGRVWIFAVCELAALALSARYTPRANADTVLSFKYTPAPRVQVAIWIEDAAGRYLRAAAITEAVAYRGIGNRPGASQMNSGYRWPYGRREGALPIWAHRRASAPGAKLFPRVIFQSRVEGHASRTTDDQSPDNYYCLQFDMGKSSKADLDAVSCASLFNSDKGRYLTATDLSHGYFEPWEIAMPAADGGTSTNGTEQPLPIGSMYPARMDAKRCTTADTCYDNADVDHYAADARAVMPEIDAVTVATPPGDSPQDVLFTVPKGWADGDYVAYIEVNLEGDYNDRWNATTFPTPLTPPDDWDQYAEFYGYPYRGQPSLVWKLPFSLGPGVAASVSTRDPIGRSSWNFWAASYGQIETLSTDPNDPQFISSNQNGSGVDRLRKDANGQRFAIDARTGVIVPPPTAAVDAGSPSSGGAHDASSPAPDAGADDAGVADASVSDADVDAAAPAASSSVGPIQNLTLSVDPNRLRSYTWVVMRFDAAQSTLPLHDYDVRVSTTPISDETSFITDARQAKNATDAAEGATLLTLPTDVPAGQPIQATIGDLNALTHYYVGVRATDELNQHGPISVAEITTTARRFATVSPCFVATAAYGSPMADQVSVLRRVRDRYLMPQAIGRASVAGYYRWGARLARLIAPHDRLRAAVRTALSPLVALAERLN